jgi:cell division protein FtsI/penicillin-binding protein 2
MGIDNLHDGLKPFNFGAITGIDIPGERGGIWFVVCCNFYARCHPQTNWGCK